MALQPVSGVTPLHTANVSFSGKRYNEKNENDEYNTSASRIPSSVKAVPVIVLMAMSPLNKVNSTTPYLPEENNNIEVVETSEMSPIIRLADVNRTKTPKVIQAFGFGNTSSKTGVPHLIIKKLSLDDNDKTYEAVELIENLGEFGHGENGTSARAIITNAYYGKSAKGEEIVQLSGFELPIDNLNDYTPGRSYREYRTPSYRATASGELHYLALLIDVLCKDENYNNGAIKMGSLAEVRNSSNSRYVREKLNKFLNE